MTPHIDFILAVHNGEHYIAETIESCLNQTYENFGIIIIDDCSKDNSPKLLENFAAQHDRITVLTNQENKGLTKSLNIAISHSKADYVARIDADDINAPNRLEQQIQAFLTTSDQKPSALCGSYADVIHADGQKVGTIEEEEFMDTISLRERIGQFKSIFPHSSFLIHRDSFMKIGGYDETFRFSQDLKLITDFLVNGFTIACRAERLIGLRRHENNISTRKSDAQAKLAIRAIASLQDGVTPMDQSQLSVAIDRIFSDSVYRQIDLNKRLIRALLQGKITVLLELIGNIHWSVMLQAIPYTPRRYKIRVVKKLKAK